MLIFPLAQEPVELFLFPTNYVYANSSNQQDLS